MISTNLWTNEYNPFNKWKVLAWYDRMKAIKSGEFMPPVNISLDLNQGTSDSKLCGGYKCNFCMGDFEDKGQRAEIPPELLMVIPAFYKDWGVKSICVAGHHSDVLMYNHKYLINFLYECRANNIEVGIVSNGRYYTDEVCEAVVQTCKWSGWSINCGKKETYTRITSMNGDGFDSVLNNIRMMVKTAKSLGCNHTVGYKYIITNENHTEILETIELASQLGVRHLQIRPGELSIERSSKIDKEFVEWQIRKGIRNYERPGEFEVFGIREKFTPIFTKNPPKRCIASPLGSTWKADGNIVICPDRRWSWDRPGMVMGNFITEGLEKIRKKWGGEEHRRMIQTANESRDSCIRCSVYQWHDLYEHVIEKDDIDVTLI